MAFGDFAVGVVSRDVEGQALTQSLQPMHLSRSKATAPSAVLYNAPDGQIFMQPASSQCMQRWLTKSQRTGFSCDGTSVYRILL